MSTLKEQALQTIADLPENATLDDIIYQLYVIEKIRQGRADIAAGNVQTFAEISAEVKTW